MSSSSSRKCISVSLDEIQKATNGFDEKKILGKGGEGTVYSAYLRIGQEESLVAVKNLDPRSKEFEQELKIMQKIHHPNIVSLLGFCKESAHKILIYEYMGKGSLSKYVRGKNILPMSWKQSLNVCLCAARGLKSLHTPTKEFPKGIIHRDVKPDNILIDENWVGKISDFGLFKVSHADQTKSLITTEMKGTRGYYAPEYMRYGHITRKIDVYSFGVVLFEVLCLKKPWDRDESYYINDKDDQGEWAQKNVHSGIVEEISHGCMIAFTDIITKSLKVNPNDRPFMDDVVLGLEKALESQNLAYEGKLRGEGTRSPGGVPLQQNQQPLPPTLLQQMIRDPSHVAGVRVSDSVMFIPTGMPRKFLTENLRANLYSKVEQLEPEAAAKVTEKLLEMDLTEVLGLLESPEDLKACVSVAMRLLSNEQYYEMRGLARAPSVAPRMPMYSPGGPGMGQQIFYGHAQPTFIPPQPGFGYQQQLVPGMRPGWAPMPNYFVPMIQQGQQGHRPGGRSPGGVPHQQNQQPIPLILPQMITDPSGLVGVPVSGGGIFVPTGMPSVTYDIGSTQSWDTGMPSVTYDIGSTQSWDAGIFQRALFDALSSALANASPTEKRIILGENLYPEVEKLEPEAAAKVTGMILELDQTEVLHLLESPEALKAKVAEAMEVLRNVSQQQAGSPADQLAALSLNDVNFS